MRKETPPNIILLLTDNQRIDQVGCHSSTLCRTPFLDSIAKGGALIKNARTTSTVCSPARASLFTGCQPHQAGVPTVHLSWPEQVRAGSAEGSLSRPIITKYLKEIGYECFYAGKWHIGDENVGPSFDAACATQTDESDYSQWCFDQGLPDGMIFHDPVRSQPYRFHEPPHMSLPTPGVLDIPDECEINRWKLDRAIELLQRHDGGKPLFMVFSTYGIHPPLQVPQKYYDLYDVNDLVEPDNFGENSRLSEPETIREGYFRRAFNYFGKDFDAWRKSIAVSHGYATYIDSLFAEFGNELEKKGILDNCLIMMTSDHGDMLGQHGLVGKFCAYEECARVPWIMRWPGKIPEGTICDFDATLPDIGATILSAAGVNIEALNLEGLDVMPYVCGGKLAPISRDCFCQFNRPEEWRSWHSTEDWRSIYRRPWKYIMYQNGEQELFNLDSDPGEKDNLAKNIGNKEIRDDLLKALRVWGNRTGDPFFS